MFGSGTLNLSECCCEFCKWLEVDLYPTEVEKNTCNFQHMDKPLEAIEWFMKFHQPLYCLGNLAVSNYCTPPILKPAIFLLLQNFPCPSAHYVEIAVRERREFSSQQGHHY